MKEQNREITEIERMAIDIDKLFYEAEIKQTLPKKHPSIVKAESLYNTGYRKIIRCKDCKCCEHCYPAKEVGRMAEEGWYCIFHKWYVNPDGFCSFAKMKGGAK